MAGRSDGFRPLGRVLEAAARRLKLDGAMREASAVSLWPQVVGEQIAAATQAERVEDGVLHVIARSHTWAFELTFHRTQILKGLNAKLGRTPIRDIRFRTGVVQTPGQPPRPAEPAPTAAELEAIILEAGEVEAVEAEAARLADPEMQAVVRRVLANERKRAAWGRHHGMKECAACGALHAGPGESCPACRNEAQR
jgi:predicted nucleic acid-binding Zn ribbon protein